ncbi:MAG: hypothetical protein QF535_22190 [Anaerolineales bacterium]|nr:hypothetical protein [Anaerolineales bacterium]
MTKKPQSHTDTVVVTNPPIRYWKKFPGNLSGDVGNVTKKVTKN